MNLFFLISTTFRTLPYCRVNIKKLIIATTIQTHTYNANRISSATKFWFSGWNFFLILMYQKFKTSVFKIMVFLPRGSSWLHHPWPWPGGRGIGRMMIMMISWWWWWWYHDDDEEDKDMWRYSSDQDYFWRQKNWWTFIATSALRLFHLILMLTMMLSKWALSIAHADNDSYAEELWRLLS